MNPIFQALSQGHDAEKILKYLAKSIPSMAAPIAKATSSGYSANQILGFFTKNFDVEDRRGMSESQRHAANTRADAERTKYGLKMAASAIATPLAARAAAGALSRALPASLQSAASQSPGTGSMTKQYGSPGGTRTSAGTQVSPPVPSPVQTPNAPSQPPASAQIPNVSALNVPQTPPQQQSKGKVSQIFDSNPILSSKVHDLAQKNGPEAIKAYFMKFAPKQVSKIEKEAGMPFENAVREYLKGSAEENAPGNLATNELPIPIPTGEKLQESELSPILPEESQEFAEKPEGKPHEMEEMEPELGKIEKKATVISPVGVGEVKEIRNGKALIEVDGKKHQVNENELEGEPTDIAELYDNLLKAIPDEYKSRVVNFAGYDEEHNELLFRPHGGSAYVYKDIPESFANELKNRMHKAKTTGKNSYGMWYEGDQSYGAGMSKLIKDLQAHYGGKGKEYVRKYNTLFDILGIPHEAKMAKEEEQRAAKRSVKDEERAAKKRAKEEEREERRRRKKNG